MVPPEIIDYVIVHALAHLRESNHTKIFWRIVSNHDPGYVEHVAWLDENSARLVFSKEDV